MEGDETGYLAHYGTLNMRWGIRRYQNKDGSLTPEGKRRYSRGEKTDLNDPDAVTSRAHSEVAADYRQRANQANAVKQASQAAANIQNRKEAKARAEDMRSIDLSDISDTELRNLLNRANMEKQYKQIATEDIDYGHRRATEILATVGDVAAVGASVAAILAAIHEIRK